MEKTWQNGLIHFEEFLTSSKIKVRHDFERVFVSSLASQVYCELKLEFDIKYQPEDTPEQILGTEIHEELIPVEPTEAKKIVEDIESGKEVVTIFPVVFSYKGVVITGIHDGIYFENNKPIYLFEIKSTKGKINKIWPGQKFQAFLYALALENMGFDTRNLQIIIPKVKQSIEKKGLIAPILFHLKNNSISKFHLENRKIHLHIFEYSARNKAETMIQLDKLIKFWTQERKANGSGNLAKCKPCSYKKECQYYQLIEKL